MDKTITTEDLASRTDRVIAEVESGESFTVTSNGKTVARIVPAQADVIASQKAARAKLLEHLDKQPARNLGPWSRDEAYE